MAQRGNQNKEFVIKFGLEGNCLNYQLGGFSDPEDGFTWSIGYSSTLSLQGLSVEDDSIICIEGKSIEHPAGGDELTIDFFINGRRLESDMQVGSRPIVLVLPRQLINKGSNYLTALYSRALRPSDFGADDTRLLAFAWTSLRFITAWRFPAVTGTRAVTADELPEHRLLRRWATEELACWRASPQSRSGLRQKLRKLNSSTHWSAIYEFGNGTVKYIPKPQHIGNDQVTYDRAQTYLAFFKRIVRCLPQKFQTVICVCAADFIESECELPVMTFQKVRGSRSILLPDIEFLQNDFYENHLTIDTFDYEQKRNQAAFSGSTTGAAITFEVARDLSTERLSAAQFFLRSPVVDFRLPNVVQCSTPEIATALKGLSFCSGPELTWTEQFQHRFLLSLDGNGAACSRLAIGLKSNSAVIKYNSKNLLFYFKGLRPYIHYLPARSHGEVIDIVAAEEASPGRARQIAEAGSLFFSKFLRRESL